MKIHIKLFTTLGLVTLLHGVASSAEPATTTDEKTQRTDQAPVDGAARKAIIAALDAHKGEFSTELRAAYLEYAERQVSGQLASAGKQVPADFLEWVRGDEVVYEAVYGSIYPPDYRILLNVQRLKRELSSEQFERFKHLVLSAAVTRRVIGVGSYPVPGKYGAALAPAMRSDKGAPAVDKTPAVAPKSEAQQLRGPDKIIDEYLKAQGLNARQAYESGEHRAALEAKLRAGGVKLKGSNALFHTLENYVVASGRRPPRRDPHPPVADYVTFLDRVLSEKVAPVPHKKGKISWPLFPVDQAPWPVLMPLTRTIPLREAEYIWHQFKDKHRYQAYGPYRRAVNARPLALEDSPWALKSWPAHARIGGVCGTMSTISMGTHTALGAPVLKAGQPGHSCVVKYDRDGRGFYKTSVGQAVSGPSRTKAAWLFADPHPGGIAANEKTLGVDMSFHMGLTLAMNQGLKQYMDARIAVHVYRMLADDERARFGRPLLLSATRINPYQVELWNLLELIHRGKDISLAARAEVLKQFHDTVRASQFDMEPWEERSPDEDLSDTDDNAVANNAPLAGHVATWASLVKPKLLQLVASHPMPDDEPTLRIVRDALRPAGGPLYIRYAMQLPDGREDVVRLLQSRIRQHRKLRGKAKPQKRLRAVFDVELKTASKQIDDADQHERFLAEVASAFPPNQRTWTFRGKPVHDPIYKLLEAAGRPTPSAQADSQGQ